MQKQQKIILTTIISVLIIFSGVAIYLVSLDPFIISESSFDTEAGIEIELGAQRLSFQLDTSKKKHFIYQLGERPRVEPDALPYNGTHVLKYATFVDNVLQVENVTDELVFPYHYEFKVDSLGKVHLAYIANNYTLYYAVKDPSTGDWTTTQLNTPSEMWALMPSIVLGANEQPRIVYSVSFKEDADEFFNQEDFELINLSSLFYAVLNGSTWLYFDVGGNHTPFSTKDINLQRIYNPGIKIDKGIAYIAFTNKVALAVDTRMQYIKISEIPEQSLDFRSIIHQRALIAPIQATTYRRPSIHLIGDGILLAFGAWSFGAGSIIYLTNSSVLENKVPALAADQWLKEALLPPTKINKQVDSIVGVEDQNGTLYLTWSLYDLFNSETKQFSQDVFLASLQPTSTEIGPIRVERVTDTTQEFHFTPSIAVNEDNDIEIQYIKEVDGIYVLKSSTFGGIGKNFDNEGLALVVSLGLIGLFVGAAIALIQLIPKPEEKIITLPHMINLKDVISED